MLKRKIFSRSPIIYNFIFWLFFMMLYLGFRYYTTYSLKSLNELILALKWFACPFLLALIASWNLLKKPKIIYYLFFIFFGFYIYKMNRYDFSENYIYLDLSVMFIYSLLYLLFNNELSQKSYRDFFSLDLLFPQIKASYQDAFITVVDYSSKCLVLETNNSHINEVRVDFLNWQALIILKPIQRIDNILVFKIINNQDWLPIYKEIKSYGFDSHIFKG
jgi:hypothetical protein